MTQISGAAFIALFPSSARRAFHHEPPLTQTHSVSTATPSASTDFKILVNTTTPRLPSARKPMKEAYPPVMPLCQMISPLPLGTVIHPSPIGTLADGPSARG